jgi:HEAT repeat protein
LELIAAGFFGGRMLPGDSLSDRPVSRLSEPLASRIRFIEPDASGQVQIVVEETRQRVLSGDPGDDRIRNLLLTAARDSSDPGVRVGTMDLLKGHSESEEVRRALIYAVQNDTNPGVRLKALEGLRNSADLPDVRRALSQVLLNDENPGVRTQSIDLLVQKREPALIGVLQELMAREENDYVRLKCQKALHEMNASVETF